MPINRRGRSRENFAKDSQANIGEREPKQPVFWDVKPALHSPKPVFGAFPKGFLEWALKLMESTSQSLVHICSGRLPANTPGVRVDLRLEARPDVVGNGTNLPFRDQTFETVILDPPYTEVYAQDLYGVDYPKPVDLLREASRITKPGGRIGFLHFIVPKSPVGTKTKSVHGVTQGPGYAIRAFTVFRKELNQGNLFS